jgi:hypothetical protein
MLVNALPCKTECCVSSLGGPHRDAAKRKHFQADPVNSAMDARILARLVLGSVSDIFGSMGDHACIKPRKTKAPSRSYPLGAFINGSFENPGIYAI